MFLLRMKFLFTDLHSQLHTSYMFMWSWVFALNIEQLLIHFKFMRYFSNVFIDFPITFQSHSRNTMVL